MMKETTYWIHTANNPNPIAIHITRKKIRNLRLRLDTKGEFKLSIPAKCSIKKAKEFIQTQLEWIEQQATITTQLQTQTPQILNGETLQWWGQTLTLEIQEIPGLAKSQAKASVSGEKIVLQIETGANLTRRTQIINKLRKQSLETRLKPLLAKWSTTFGKSPSEVKIRSMKTRWGSCQPTTGKLTFNLELSTRDPKYLDYVVAHEYTHFFHPNHGNEFHALLSKHIPAQRQLHRELNQTNRNKTPTTH